MKKNLLIAVLFLLIFNISAGACTQVRCTPTDGQNGPALNCDAYISYCMTRNDFVSIPGDCEGWEGIYDFVGIVDGNEQYEMEITDGERRIFIVDPEGNCWVVVVKD